jgi:hypothetical protein
MSYFGGIAVVTRQLVPNGRNFARNGGQKMSEKPVEYASAGY